MSARIEYEAGDFSGPPYKSREACMAVMNNITRLRNLEIFPHCRPDWDQYTRLCWPPTLPEQVVNLPCPDDGYLNPRQNATRRCMHNATWYVNYTFEQKPYTDYSDCFLPDIPTAEDDLKKLVNTKVLAILKALDEYRQFYLTCHVVSIALLLAVIIMCIAVVLKMKKRRQEMHLYYSYGLLATAAGALLINHIVTVSTSAVDDAANVIKCRIAKSLILCSVLVFYECLFGYLYFCIVPILQIVIRRMCLKLVIAAFLVTTIVAVLVELLMELFDCPSHYCGFRTLQSSYHWFTTAPRLLLVMGVICLDIVIIFGAFCLKQPHMDKSGELCNIRQKSLRAVLMIMFITVSEILLVLLHTEAYLQYSELPMEEYFHAYSLVISVQGIVFSAIMCLTDFEVLALLGLPLTCASLRAGSEARSHQEAPTFSMSEGQFSHDKCQCDLANHDQDLLQANENPRTEVTCETASPEDDVDIMPKTYESRLEYGPLK